MRYFIIAGEASGDLHASNLVRALKEHDPEAVFAFMGGDFLSEATGERPIFHYREVAFMGFIPVLTHLGVIRRAGEHVQEQMRAFNPDVVIAVDYPGFNMRYVLPFVREELGKPIVYYISPKVWAWKSWRIKTLKKYVDLMLCILPFEKDFFAGHDFPVIYVGNPCYDAVKQHMRPTIEEQERSAKDSRQVALLCGSRLLEVKENLPVMLRVMKQFPDYRPVIAGAPGLTIQDYTPFLPDDSIPVVFGRTYEILRESKAALVTSGTATLETALIGTPQVVCYYIRGGRLTNLIFKYCFGTPYISLTNLIAGRAVVPELFGALFTEKRLAASLSPLLDTSSAERQAQLSGYDSIRKSIGTDNTSDKAARHIIARFAKDNARPSSL
ncbi:lipid-A-disaccharide synthase [Porphyromonas gingivalis]|uniref:lipid-A-disaccharide synthase n=1 Tax=Porphyromonas gingivalis TaxID=837 RepID=UPI0003653C92|nr:lipid-A-disaccharide synthase [Porphyromonas gingivalis]EOA09933.1 lipid-A-disaccharide synthase [Porphyromonas gingivalis JCVI SC001]PDP55532.1 lipid-A-disaccharide synthase [Porphyromonas gingivalis]